MKRTIFIGNWAALLSAAFSVNFLGGAGGSVKEVGMGGLSPERAREILEQKFPEISRETRQAVETIFWSLVNRLTLVRLNPLLQYGALVNPELTTECLVHLICEDLRAGGRAPAFITMRRVEGSVGGTEGWIVLTFKEWSGGR